MADARQVDNDGAGNYLPIPPVTPVTGVTELLPGDSGDSGDTPYLGGVA